MPELLFTHHCPELRILELFFAAALIKVAIRFITLNIAFEVPCSRVNAVMDIRCPYFIFTEVEIIAGGMDLVITLIILLFLLFLPLFEIFTEMVELFPVVVENLEIFPVVLPELLITHH